MVASPPTDRPYRSFLSQFFFFFFPQKRGLVDSNITLFLTFEFFPAFQVIPLKLIKEFFLSNGLLLLESAGPHKVSVVCPLDSAFETGGP